MTVIVAVRDAQGVVIGCDSQVTHGWSATRSSLSKVVVHQSGGRAVYIGVSGQMRFQDLVRYAPIPGDLSPGRDEHEWLVQAAVPVIRGHCEAAGWTEKEKGREDNDCVCIVVVGGRIFKLGSDWSVTEADAPFSATGSGWMLAKGALEALRHARPEMSAEDRALAALEAACAHDIWCSAPLIIQRCEP